MTNLKDNNNQQHQFTNCQQQVSILVHDNIQNHENKGKINPPEMNMLKGSIETDLLRLVFVLQEEAVSYYTKREAKLKEEYRKEKEKVHTKPLGMAFVTFQNEAMTAM